MADLLPSTESIHIHSAAATIHLLQTQVAGHGGW